MLNTINFILFYFIDKETREKFITEWEQNYTNREYKNSKKTESL